MFRKKKQPTLTDQTVAAVDRMAVEVEDLREERGMALSSFRDTAEWLGKINADLAQKSALCGTLVAQLKASQESIAQQTEDNARVREKILELIGE